jgi:hypothetical protein
MPNSNVVTSERKGCLLATVITDNSPAEKVFINSIYNFYLLFL